MKKKVLVRGPALSQSGYGEHARMILRALHQREDLFDVYIIPTGWGHTGWISNHDEFRSWMDSRILITQTALQQKTPFDMSVQVSIPNEFERLTPINIGITAGVETNKVSPVWLQKCNEMDKIIVPSTFAKWGLENTTYQGQDQHGNPATLKLQVPVEVIPYPVRDDVEVLPEFPSLKLNEDDFAYILVGQWGPRKNMDNAIRWWLEENWEEKTTLIVKTSHRRNNIMDREFTQNRLTALLRSVKADPAKRKCSLKLLHGDMSEAEMKTLYAHPAIRCMVTATHGEGFGLPLFEFAQTGKLIVAPGWSGHLDFLTYPNEKGEPTKGFLEVDYTVGQVQKEAVWDGVIQADSSWAFPLETSYKQRVRQARTKWRKLEPKAKELAKHIEEAFKNGYLNEVILDSILGRPKKGKTEIDGISFCIPTNGKRPDKTELTIKSIKSQTEVPVEIILCGDVDNFRHIEGITLVDRKEEAHSRKVALLRNKAAEVSKYNTIAWCDDDIILDNEWGKTINTYSNLNSWEVLGTRILNPDGTRHWDRGILNPRILVDYDFPSYSKNLIQTSGFFLVKKEVYDKVKWDENKLVFSDRDGSGIPEDVQYTLDLISNGYQVFIDKELTVWHNDSRYTEFNNQTLMKEEITKRTGISFFPTGNPKYENLLELLQ
jgi:glycosyltransferase involved in cell wall biosynthesis/GT2 family glycosyltransferase